MILCIANKLSFEISFQFCTKPITQRYFIAIDVSNSMFGKNERHIDYQPRSGCRGCPALLPAEVAAAMTMVFLNGCTKSPKIMAFSDDIAELDIKKDMNLSNVLELIGRVGSHCCFQLKFMTVLSIMLIMNQCQKIAFKLYHDSKMTFLQIYGVWLSSGPSSGSQQHDIYARITFQVLT